MSACIAHGRWLARLRFHSIRVRLGMRSSSRLQQGRQPLRVRRPTFFTEQTSSWSRRHLSDLHFAVAARLSVRSILHLGIRERSRWPCVTFQQPASMTLSSLGVRILGLLAETLLEDSSRRAVGTTGPSIRHLVSPKVLVQDPRFTAVGVNNTVVIARGLPKL